MARLLYQSNKPCDYTHSSSTVSVYSGNNMVEIHTAERVSIYNNSAPDKRNALGTCTQPASNGRNKHYNAYYLYSPPETRDVIHSVSSREPMSMFRKVRVVPCCTPYIR